MIQSILTVIIGLAFVVMIGAIMIGLNIIATEAEIEAQEYVKRYKDEFKSDNK